MRRVAVRHLVHSISAISLVLLWSGCDLPRESQPSVLVVAVEGLNFGALSCDSDEANGRFSENLRPFCEETVRFSHAFAPSTLAQPTMSSLMTGLYPIDHGVHNNGSDFLSAKFRTVAEAALNRDFHTLFVSGGAPIWRKSGLAQGFEVFDDVMDISIGNYYRPANEVVRIATNWADHESSNTPFFMTLYLNDLQFSDNQVEHVTDSLAKLVHWLKAKRRWNSTYVVLVGLNSLQRHENDNEPLPLSLRSESVQVTLFIKPARKEQDHAIQWAVDRNVSLVDVGHTLMEWVDAEGPASSLAELEPQRLRTAVQQSDPQWKADHLILSESAWPEWLEGAGTRLAIRQNQLLYINDQKPQIFNTLTDRLETVPLRTNDPLWTSLNQDVLGLLQKIKSPSWVGMSDHWARQIDVAHELWWRGLQSHDVSGKEAWAKWYLWLALMRKDWSEVKRLAQASGDALGVFVASRHLNEATTPVRNACVRLVLGMHGEKRFYQTECQDDGILALHSWQAAKTEEERTLAQDRFFRIYGMLLMDQEIGRLNFLNELRWDVDRELPRAPQALDYVLTLKELEPFAKKVSAFVSGKNLTF